MTRFVLLFAALPALAQEPVWTDAFADGEFRSAPPWTGDTAAFTVRDGALRSAGPAASSHLGLFTALPPGTAGGQREWRFRWRLDFDPSSSNYGRLWLCAERPDADDPGSGYLLQVGEAGATGSDSLDVYRSDGGALTRLAVSPFPVVDGGTVDLALRVRRDSLGAWTVAVASAPPPPVPWTEPAWAEAAAFTDTGHVPVGWTGWACRYSTASRAEAYALERIYAGPPVRDRVPPAWTELAVTGEDALRLGFSEPMDGARAGDPARYRLDGLPGGGVPPLLALWAPDAPGRVDLLFDAPFPPGQPLRLRVEGLADAAGNLLPPDSVGFSWWDPGPGDVLLAELMIDETPSRGLPEAEYVELLSRAPVALDLAGWTLADAAGAAVLPPLVLPPGGRALLCAAGDSAAWRPALPPGVPVLGLADFPALNNDADRLRLRAPDGVPVDAVAWDGWDHEGGGRAWERVDPSRPWLGACGWSLSPAAPGGTPGRENAAAFPPGPAPMLTAALAEGPSALRAVFDAPMDSASLVGDARLPDSLRAVWVLLDPAGDTLGWAAPPEPLGPDFARTRLLPARPLESGVAYTLGVRGAAGCPGRAGAGGVRTGLAEPPDSADVVIHELLYDPRSGGTDFVELRNRSARIVDLAGAYLVEGDPADPARTLDVAAVAPGGRLLFPGEHLALTADPAATARDYPLAALAWPSAEGHVPAGAADGTGEDAADGGWAGGLWAVPDLPSWPDADDSGVVRLEWRDPSGALRVLDELRYRADWHHPLLGDPEGVSLERLDPGRSAERADNWHSGAPRTGWATPGAPNAMALPPSGETLPAGSVRAEPLPFSPDGDGRDDLLRLHWAFPGPGWVASAALYDRRGLPVRALANNEPLPPEGYWVWDGLTAEGRPAAAGPYVAVVSWWHPDGATGRARARVVLARRH